IVRECAQELFGHIVIHQLTQLTAQGRDLLSHFKVHVCAYPDSTTGSTSCASMPSSASTRSVSAPNSGAGPATFPGVRENHVGTPGKRTGPCGVSTVSNRPTAFRCALSKSSSGVLTGAAGISNLPNN